jgi:antitoxin component YwqK of YwqJK toxin-antitoxin module
MLLGKSAHSVSPQQRIIPIITNSQFTDFDTNYYDTAKKATERSTSKPPRDSSLHTPKVKFSGGSGYEEFYDSNGYLHYKGDTKNGLANGKGILFHRNGVVEYEGDFVDNLLHGRGNLYNEQGNLTFKGDFSDGIRIGKVFHAKNFRHWC